MVMPPGMEQMMGGGMGMGQGMMPQQPQMPMQRDPLLELNQMQRVMEQTTPLGPVYPRWLLDNMPRKPDARKIDEIAIKRFDEYSTWRAALRLDLLLLRMSESGIFEDDRHDILAEIMEKYQSTGLVDEFNLAVSWMSGLKRRVIKKPGAEEVKDYTRKIKLAAEWLMDAEAQCHTDKGEMPTEVLEPKLLLSYGMIAKRRVLDRYAEPYYSPFLTRYIDPAQLVPEWDDRGLKRLYRVYSASVRDIADTYGDFTDANKKTLEDKFGKLDDDLEMTNIVEYWDRWYRCVTCGGVELLKVIDHRYGEVPYTIGYGPLGEPKLTQLPEASGAASMTSQTFRDSLPYKSVSYVGYRKIAHTLHEAIMTRQLYGLKKELWPPYIRMRSAAASLKPAPDLDSSPGAPNEGILGEEEFVDFPVPRSNGMDRQNLMQALERDRMTGSAPLSAYGHMDQSNISGTANKQAAQAGHHLWKPWVRSLESFAARDATKAMRIWQRLGQSVEYAQETRRPFTVPVSKPYAGESGSFELNKDVIDKVGPEVQISMVSVNPEEWLLRAQTLDVMNDRGFSLEFLVPELFGIEYDQQTFEEWQEEKAIRLAMEHPKFLELEMIPTMLLSEMTEAEGNPELQAYLAKMAQRWEELVVAPAQLQHDMEMQQYQQQQAAPTPGEAVPTGGNPPTTAGVSLPESGQGPGSVSQQQGGPRGPLGPRTSPAQGE